MPADHYQTLQVARHAEQAVIDKAYRALSLRYHPDTAEADGESANRRMQRINEAYAVLRNPAKRARYDATLPAERDRRSGWDVFWDEGLVGLYLNRSRRS